MRTNGKRIIATILLLSLSMVLFGCSSTKTEKDNKKNEITVSNIDELLDAIGPNTVIHMNPGSYNIADAESYGVDDADGWYIWNDYGYENEYELQIYDVDNLSIIGQNAEILTIPRVATVIVFKNCSDIILDGITVGHTQAAVACEGGVARFDLCENVKIDNCSLYGCGTIGIWTSSTKKIEVVNTEIHHCSSAAVSADKSVDITMEKCKFYDCGSSEPCCKALGAFVLYDVDGFAVSGCEIHNNYFESLITGYTLKNIVLNSLSVHDNHISVLFDYEGDVEINDFNIRNNVIDSCTGYIGENFIVIDGKQLTRDDIVQMLGEQLSSYGIGKVETEPREIDITCANEVHVKTANDFLAAIASDTVLYIDVPQINLTDASSYPTVVEDDYWNSPEFNNSNYVWSPVYDGYELCIGNVDNFHIRGGEIVTEPRYANVISFYNCTNITLENVTLGHTLEQGECGGGVLYFSDNTDIILKGCDLYGCGTLGINADCVKNLQVEDTLIHDCSYGASIFYDSDGVMFIDSKINNCPSPHFALQNCTGFTWNGTLMDANSTFNVE